jgi:hypothetical protein
MTNTRDKLNEAKYFLEEMKRVSSDPNNFRYELTAFLAASRSITQIMQKEFSEKPGFNEWYTNKQREMGNEPILKYLHRQRTISYHEHPVLPYPIGITDQIADGTGMNVVLTGTSSNASLSFGRSALPITLPFINITYYFDDMPSRDKDVITICQEAVNTLELIVDECEKKFIIE